MEMAGAILRLIFDHTIGNILRMLAVIRLPKLEHGKLSHGFVATLIVIMGYGLVTALAFVMGRPELVLFFGIVYIWDAMTVVIQRVYFKATHGKRIFRMTPIHHAFEMRGWREVKIDAFFAFIAVIGVAMGMLYICVA